MASCMVGIDNFNNWVCEHDEIQACSHDMLPLEKLLPNRLYL